MSSVSEDRSPFDGIRPTDFFEIPLWLLGMRDAIKRDEIKDEFKLDTGSQWEPPHENRPQREHDEFGFRFSRAFATWWTDRYWDAQPGPLDTKQPSLN